MSEQADERWVLAFDGACGTCASIASAVEEASDGKLEVLPLSHPDVRRWRRLGTRSTTWEPTLLRVRGGQVRAWTRPLMAFQLAKRLGPRSTRRVLDALGRLRSAHGPRSSRGEGPMGRKRFMSLVAGAGVAATLTLTGRTPAFARSQAATAREWAAAHRSELPRTYAEITRHSVPYRKAILAELSPEERGRLWAEHFDRFRAARANLSPAQNAVVDDASHVARRVFHYGTQQRTEEVRNLEVAAKREFGNEEAAALLANFGPVDPASDQAAQANCNCATDSDYCGTQCYRGGCTLVPNNCGSLWVFDCNGRCAF